MGHAHSHSHGRGGYHSHAPDPAAERDMEKKQSMGAYAFLHITLFSGLLYFDNRFKAALFGGEVLLPAAFIGLMVTGWILYIRVSYSNPGFVGKEEMRASGRNAKGYAAISTNEEDQTGPETAISIDNPVAESSQITPLPSPPNAMNTSAASYQAMMAPLEAQVGCNPAAAIANGAQATAGPAAAANSTVIRVHEREDFCWHCSMIMPPRAKHCERCEQCVIKFDHHCPFVANCIGGKNHMRFWWFLFIETLQLSWVLYMCFTMFTELALDAFGEWLTRACFTIYAFIVLLMVSSLWGFHTYLACINKTTLEMVREQRAQFRARTRYLDESRNRVRGPPSYDEGFVKNIRMFCLGDMKPEWTKGIPHTPPTATFPQGSNTTYEQQARILGHDGMRAIQEEAVLLQQARDNGAAVPASQSYPTPSPPQASPVVRRPSPSAL